MDRYFDAFLYMASWGQHTLKLRVPARDLPLATVRPYTAERYLSARVRRSHVILSFEMAQDIDPEDEDFSLARLVGIRDELLRGDLRALYLGWLYSIQHGSADEDYDEDGDEVGEAALEPAVPPGLRTLSAPLAKLVDFLQIDPKLVKTGNLKIFQYPQILLIDKYRRRQIACAIFAYYTTSVSGQEQLPFRQHGGRRRGAGRRPKSARAGAPHKRRPVLDRDLQRVPAPAQADHRSCREVPVINNPCEIVQRM